MGGQVDCLGLDASTRTRILTPSLEGLFNNHDVSMVESKKRKRENGTTEDLLEEPFVVKPHPSTVFTKPHTLNPLALVSRMHVPISSLDIISPTGPLPASRLFEAHIKVLELEERMGNKHMVLIAQSSDGKSVFVVERVEQNLYAICKVGSWVSLSHLCTRAIISRHQTSKGASRSEAKSLLHEDEVGLQVTPESSKYNNKKRHAIEAIRSMIKRPPTAGFLAPQDKVQPFSQLGTVQKLQSPIESKSEVIEDEIYKLPKATEMFENVRMQYFEALYLSRASLAYFAKGPLSRARAAFHLDYDSTLDMNELIEFLESLILPTTVVDKKYKDGVPKLLSSLLPDGSVDDRTQTPRKVKKVKSKKLKPGKNGLYPAEDAYICQWWGSYSTDIDKADPGDSKDEVNRKRVAQLRIREMQLQIIVILETLALKSLAVSSVNQSGELPSTNQLDDGSQCEPAACFKSKKPLDLAVLMEVNIDRLCIWQSLAAEESRATSTLGGSSGIGLKSNGNASTHHHAADILRGFCVEVVVPFFSARLPEQCSAVCRKMGSPIGVSPARPNLTAFSNIFAASSRSEGIRRNSALNNGRRSLRRVTTDERHVREGSRSNSSAISLMRSATAPTIPALKRERSETPLLAGILPAESKSMLVKRRVVLKSKNFSQREVDLSSLATINDTKVKTASIEADLKEAISALKKPNRLLAGQFQIEAERRAASAPTHIRKSKKPVRNPSFQDVQILSTPRRNRKKELVVGTCPKSGLDLEQSHELDVILPSSTPVIPLSMARAPGSREPPNMLLCEATPARPVTKTNPVLFGTLFHTETDSSSRPLNMSGVSPQKYDGSSPLPLQSRRSDGEQSLDILSSFSQAVQCTPSKSAAIDATAVKQWRFNLIEADAHDKSDINVQVTGMEKSASQGMLDVRQSSEDDLIYKSLGWDD